MTYDTVKIFKAHGSLIFTGPYHPEFPHHARKLGGDHRGQGMWVFDRRDEERVRALAIQIYGTDGTPGPTVTVRVKLDDHDRALAPQRGGEELWLYGRCLVARNERDQPVRLGPNVVVLEGGFPDSGGSRANPRILAAPGTVLEVRDVPAAHPHLTYRPEAVLDEEPTNPPPEEEQVTVRRADLADLLYYVLGDDPIKTLDDAVIDRLVKAVKP